MSYYKLRSKYANWLNEVIERAKGQNLIISNIENQVEMDYGFTRKMLIMSLKRFEKQGLIELNEAKDEVKVLK